MTCRCHHPKKQRIGDDAKGLRLLYCEQHGFSLKKTPLYSQPPTLYLRMPKASCSMYGQQQGKVE
jgi:hypothetical protein